MASATSFVSKIPPPKASTRERLENGTRYINPLFKSAPSDNLHGDARRTSHDHEEFKENHGMPERMYGGRPGFSKTKCFKSSPLASIPAKRILGECNDVLELRQPVCIAAEEVHSPISVVSSPEAEPQIISDISFKISPLSTSDESVSEPTTPRGPISPQQCVSPEFRENGNDSDTSIDYDPKVNLLTPRPTFLRYQPDWRSQFIRSLESKDDPSGLIFNLQSESDEIETTQHVEKQQPAAGTVEEIEEESKSKKLVDVGDVGDVAEAFVDDVEDEEVDGDGEVMASSLARSSVYTALLLLFITCVLLTAGSPGLLPQAALVNPFSHYFERCPYREEISGKIFGDGVWRSSSSSSSVGTEYSPVDPQALYMSIRKSVVGDDDDDDDDDGDGDGDDQRMNEFEWDWVSEYDIQYIWLGIIGNATGDDLMSMGTDSKELDALLRAIVYGTVEEVEEKYAEMLEVGGDVDVVGYDDDDYYESSSPSSSDDSSSSPSFEEYFRHSSSSTEVGEEYSDATTEAYNDGVDDGDDGHDDDDVVDGDDGHDDNVVDGDDEHDEYVVVSPRFGNALSLLASALLSFPTYLIYRATKEWKKKRRMKIRRSQTAAADAAAVVAAAVDDVGDDGGVVVGDIDIDELIVAPDCFRDSPYGSFTAYKRMVVKEGPTGNEEVRLTPVRRSSRIAQHHQQQQQQQQQQYSPLVHRRVLLSPP